MPLILGHPLRLSLREADFRNNPFAQRNSQGQAQNIPHHDFESENPPRSPRPLSKSESSPKKNHEHPPTKDKENTWRESIEALLGSLENKFFQPYCISVVPEKLRKWNENAYMPTVVSIGPRYNRRRNLLQMEQIKWHCMISLLKRTQDAVKGFEKCMQGILEYDAAVRASYVDEIKLDRYTLATIMVCDGCFLLELLMTASENWENEVTDSTRLGVEVVKDKEVLLDLMLLENQIPLFILNKLFKLLFPEKEGSELINMALSWFGCSQDWINKSSFTLHLYEVAHFLELVHRSFFLEHERELRQEENQEHVVQIESPGLVELNRCATRLLAAGIKIKPRNREKGNNSPHKVSSFQSGLTVNYSQGILEIPQLHINQTTAIEWKNFIAWEHHMYNSIMAEDQPRLFTSLAILFKDLICCASDVKVLKDKGVIVIKDDSKISSNQGVHAFFYSITLGVNRAIVYPGYSKMFHRLNRRTYNYCARYLTIPWHSCMRIFEAVCIIFSIFHLDDSKQGFNQRMLWHSYKSTRHNMFVSFYNFLRSGYNFVAAMIFVFTFIQTFYAILTYHHSNNCD